MEEEKIKLGEYEHYKGMRYRVLGVVKHSETLQELVLYETLYDNPESKLWVRPLTMFVENVTIEGKTLPRFRYVGK